MIDWKKVAEYLSVQLAEWMESEMAATGMGLHDIDPRELIRDAVKATGGRW